MVKMVGRTLSQDHMKGLLEVCDPAGTGLVSIEYLVSLAAQHYKTREDAERVIKRLDHRGRGYLTYKEFFMGVSTVLRRGGSPQASPLRNSGQTQASQSPLRNSGQTQASQSPLRHSGGRDMMGPSLEQRCPPENNSKTSHYITTSNDDVTLSSNDSNDKLNSLSMSEGESYECYGEVEMETSAPTNMASGDGAQRTTNGNNLRRNTWFRTSLRRTRNNPEVLPNRRWGSFRHTSGKRLATNNLAGGQLHRSSSFNSSGRCSNCDTGEDVYSDGSLEEEYLDLNHKVQLIQQQMNVLADNQNQSDERYTRAKQENATLQARIHMLEEQLREVELRTEERLVEEERRHRELVARVDREKQLQVENCAIRLQKLELENSSLKDEATRCRTQAERLRAEKHKLEEQMRESEGSIGHLKDEISTLREQERKFREKSHANQKLIEELNLEVEKLRSEQSQALEELTSRSNGIPAATHEQLQAQFSAMKDENRRLQEAHDEMQALLLTRSVEEGRSLLTENKSLAAELEDMSQEELGEVTREELKMADALKEQQEVNAHLKSYIESILLGVVENYPELLEVKSNP